jgi:hypothetical protein
MSTSGLSNLVNQNEEYQTQFTDELKSQLDSLLHSGSLNNDAVSIQRISDFILNKIHLKVA